MKSLQLTFLAAAAAALASCAQGGGPRTAGPAGRDTVMVVDTVRVATESGANDELEDLVARLQIQVIERDELLREVREQLESTRLELVRTMARLQTQASRAEAASGMAEAEIALGTLRRSPSGRALPELSQAESLFAQSSAAFAEENYGGALYLATQSRALVRGAQGRLRDGGRDLRAGESIFAVPVPLRTNARSNVRSGPGLGFQVAFIVDGGAPVVGQSHTDQWVRVLDEQDREGWIFHTLVSGRE